MRKLVHGTPFLMLVGSIFPLAFIFLAPLFGLNGKLALLIVIVAVFVCHLLFMHYINKADSTTEED
ncbi:MAG: hypothetical protein HKN33_07575 [Pyrinomonadaceae bacterium]|nr:hypothetical protein [Pyrinomonadaceae bacterium]